MPQRNFNLLPILLLLAALLSACGGGGDSPPEQGAIIGGTPPGGGGGGGTPTTPVYSLGAGSGANFQSGRLAIASPSLAAGGSTSISVSIVDQNGVLYATPTDVTFSSPCIGQSLATVTTPVSTASGVATTTYVARGCSGADIVTATATVGEQSLLATGTITVAAAAVGSIEFVSATPTNISLRGSGSPSLPETSTVVFRVRDSSNGPRVNSSVMFSLVSATGGVTISPLTATSDAMGLVQTIVSSGTVPTTVAVRALVDGTGIGTQSSPLTVTTSIVDGDSISLSVRCHNAEALVVDGTVVPVTVRMADRFNNPVPDGTAANFRTEGGAIGGQCVTTTVIDDVTQQPVGGVCTVNWVSQSPRPADGRATLLVTATGEESFTDTNGDGFFSAGENFLDLGEPYLDANESGSYDPGESYLDFGTPNGVRDGGDSLFNGVLCTHPTLCGVTRASPVASSNLIILSGSSPDVDMVDSTGAIVSPQALTVAANASVAARFWIRDVNDNVMPGSTRITANVSGTGFTINEPSIQTVACTPQAAGVIASGTTAFTFIVTGADTVGTGVLTLSVETPRGLTTIATFPIN